MKKILSALSAIGLLSCVCLAGCGDDYETKIARNSIFNVEANVIITTDFSDTDTAAKAEDFNGQVRSFLKQLESSLSTSVETSYVYAFNEAAAGETVEIDELTYNVLTKAESVYQMTDGYYNPAVYYSVDLYGFSVRSSSTPAQAYDRTAVSTDNGSYLPLPDSKYIEAFKELSTHFGEIELKTDNGKYYATKPADAFVTVDDLIYNMKIDLGGIGKGYCADVVNEMFDEYGFEYGVFNFGYSSMSIKKSYESSDGNWSLSIDDPRVNYGTYLKLSVSSVCLSTSGDNEKYYEIDGTRYCHIIDSTTGSPIQTGIASVTIIGGSAAEDDALTTALSAMGLEKAVVFINEKLTDRKVIMLYAGGDVPEIITNVPDEITILNSNYKVANTVQDGKIVLN